jgi:hypothetical protein
MYIQHQVNSFKNILTALFLLVSLIGFCDQVDTLMIKQTSQPPIINGVENDYCWQITEWSPIDNVWIDWGTEIDDNDFKGAFKVVWSKDENLLYFLVRTYDDVLVDGYIPGITADNYNFDILELFIDEDHSKGKHLFDDKLTGENAENAFAYHIHSRFPSNGETTDSFRVQDIAGTGYDNRLDPVYNHHFENFSLRLIDSIAYWEFSLKVYNDSYDNAEPESSRMNLNGGKVMGLSIAYCDNDGLDEEPATRDNFIGSVWVPEEAFNDHWKDAEYFGVAKLIAEDAQSSNIDDISFEESIFFPNPVSNGILNIDFRDQASSEPVTWSIFTVDGKLIQVDNALILENKMQIDISQLNTGIYILQVSYDQIQLRKNFQVIH